MITDKDETEKRARRTAGVTGAAAAVGVAAGVAAGALVEEETEPQSASPAARDPFDDLVPPAPAASTAAAVTDAPTATAASPSVIDTDDSVNPAVAADVAEAPDAGGAPVMAVAAPPAPAPAAPAPTVATPVAPEPAAEQPVVVAEEPVVVAEEPVVVEEPAAAAHPTEPPAVLPPVEDMPVGGGMEPLDPIDPMPPLIGGPMDGPIDDPFATPMPMEPEIELPAPFDAPTDGFDGGGVDGPARPVTLPDPTPTDPIAPPPVVQEPIIIDVVVQNAAMDAVAQFGKYVEGFGEVPFKELGVIDKGEFWRAIKRLDPELTGTVTELSFAVQEGYTLAEIAEHYDVNIAELAQMVELDPDGAATFAELVQVGPQTSSLGEINVISFEANGQTYFVGSDGQAWPEGEPEAAFSVLSHDAHWFDAPPETNWGWLFFSDTSYGKEVYPTLD